MTTATPIQVITPDILPIRIECYGNTDPAIISLVLATHQLPSSEDNTDYLIAYILSKA